MTAARLLHDLRHFTWEGRATIETATRTALDGTRTLDVPTFVNEFWTSKQREANSLHEVSYRACFKPQLPRFFIDRLTADGDVVYDPFSGRGTTPLEAALAGRIPYASDINPLSAILLEPRLRPPLLDDIRRHLDGIDFPHAQDVPGDLLAFYHPDTLRELCALREYLMTRARTGSLDAADRWIRMVAVNRLTGHSPGFFSVYTLPPNQATSVQAQRKINLARSQTPPRRDVPAIILKKTKTLLKDCGADDRARLRHASERARVLTAAARHTPGIPDASVRLVVTSPPFLNVVNYKYDNWLRCWFCGINPDDVRLTVPQSVKTWQAAMTRVFHELHRVLGSGGFVAFEVGEVRGGAVRLEDAVIPAGMHAGLEPLLVLINSQQFTKTANVWGVTNNRLGTNTNRVVVFTKRV